MKKAIKYHDKYGPSILCAALFVAVVLNAVFELNERGFVNLGSWEGSKTGECKHEWSCA
jgi:hypothetical protein